MKLILGVLCALVFCMNSPARAVVNVALPQGVNVLAVNGQNSTITQLVSLPNGVNQLAIQVVKDLGKHMDSDMEYSDIFVLKFTAVDQQLTMRIPRMSTTQSIRNFNEKPNIVIATLDGNKVEFAVDKLVKEGFQLMRDYEVELASFNQTRSPAALTALEVRRTTEPSGNGESNSMPKSTQALPHSVTSEGTKPHPAMSENMLKYWYEHADEATRLKFKNWINK